MERIGLAPGSQIGGYTIVAPLGSGGMGTVYRAVDDGGTAVALKLLHPQIGADPQGRERLRREVVALQRLRHKAVASVLDAEADSTEAFIVTELVAGPNLEDHVKAAGPLDADELRALADGLLAALAAVHGAGVVHRDLKPTNVLVADDGPVLIDFGIAQAAGDDAAQVTSTGLVVGTPGYLAPELLDGAEPSPATDLWGMAAVLAFAATGRPPFGTRPLQAVLARARAGEVDLDGVGPLTADALRRALDPDPDARLDAADLVAALTVAAADGDPLDGPDAPTVALAADDERDEPHDADGADEDDDEEDEDPADETTALAATTVIDNPVIDKAAADATRTLPAQGVHDGGTRVMPADLYDDLDNPTEIDLDLDPATQTQHLDPDGFRRPTPDEDWGDEEWAEGEWADEEGVEWIEEDLDASEVVPEGSGYVRPPAVRRWGSLLSIAALVAALAALAPAVVLVVLVVVLLLVRTFGTAVEAMHTRREVKGVRPSDVARTAAATPWYLLRAVVGLVPSVVVASCATLLVGGVIAWLVDNGTWTIGDLTTGDEVDGPTAAMVAAALVVLWLVVAWWGPASAMTRTGARRALAVVAPRGLGALVLVGVCLVAAVVVASLVSNGAGLVWAPAPTPTIP